MGFATGVMVVVAPTIINGACAGGLAVLREELTVRMVVAAVLMAMVRARVAPGSAAGSVV